MASLSTTKGGKRLIQFADGDGVRKTIHLGKTTKKQAESARRFVEDLIASRTMGSAPADTTAEWVANLPEAMRGRLERVGLVEPQKGRDRPTLGEWLAEYVDGRQDVKASTMLVYGHTRRNLLAFFGEDRRLDAVTPGDADAFRVFLATEQNLAANTVARRMGYAVQYFRAAVRRKIIAENPFAGQSSAVRENRERFHFVTAAEAEAVLAACPDAKWRLVFALCRYGGLRCASEVSRLRWADVNWEKDRLPCERRRPNTAKAAACGSCRSSRIAPPPGSSVGSGRGRGGLLLPAVRQRKPTLQKEHAGNRAAGWPEPLAEAVPELPKHKGDRTGRAFPGSRGLCLDWQLAEDSPTALPATDRTPLHKGGVQRAAKCAAFHPR